MQRTVKKSHLFRFVALLALKDSEDNSKSSGWIILRGLTSDIYMLVANEYGGDNG